MPDRSSTYNSTNNTRHKVFIGDLKCGGGREGEGVWRREGMSTKYHLQHFKTPLKGKSPNAKYTANATSAGKPTDCW